MGSQIKLPRSRILEPGKDVPVFTCVCVYLLSGVHCFATPWTIALQGPLFMEFPRWEYWGELPFPSPGDRPDPRLEHGSPALQVDSLPLSQQGSPPVFIPLCLCCALLSSRSQKKKSPYIPTTSILFLHQYASKDTYLVYGFIYQLYGNESQN